jgi:predicted lipid-binding transport protein (Tim44 family)
VPTALLLYLLATSLYTGFQLTVRLLVYPQMALVPPPDWVRYEAAHQTRISLVVGPLFAGLVLTVAGLLIAPEVAAGAEVLAVLLLAGLLAVTAFGAVPQHRVLSEDFVPAAHHRLLRWDTVRVLLAVAQTGLAVAAAWRS